MSMAIVNMLKNSLGSIATMSSTQMGNIMIFTSIAGWLASSAAQIFGISRNKNYTHDQKKYMIKQEIFDASTNIGLYFLITKSLTSMSTNMVQTAKLAPKSIVEFMRRRGVIGNRGMKGFDVTQVKGFDEEGMRGTYNAFKCFADAAAATTGGIISSNIITPVVRNCFASCRHTTTNNGGQTPDPVAPNNPQPTQNPVVYPPRHTFDDFRTRVFTGGGMKI